MGAGVAARISEIFSYKETGKSIFLYRIQFLRQKKVWRLGGEGVGCG